MRKFVSFALVCLIIVSLLAFTVSAERKPGEYTYEDAEALVNLFEHEPGIILLRFKKEVSYDTAKAYLENLGFPADFTDKTNKKFYVRSYSEQRGSSYFVLFVTEERLAEMLLAFLNCDLVADVSPDYLSEPSEPDIKNGDVNTDGNIDAFDYLMIKSAVLGSYELTDSQRVLADVNYDGLVNAFDYQLLKYMVLH